MGNSENLNLAVRSSDAKKIISILDWTDSVLREEVKIRCDDFLLGRYTFTFQSLKSVMLFKLRWHNGQSD